MGSSKKRVAVLGGGCGAMSAAWAITQVPGWQDDYELTVYQMGWRLGGKGASGRNAAVADRIEEHGLHVWAGFYDNAFGTLRDVYEALDRPEGHPMRTWRDGFAPHSDVALMEFAEGSWRTWLQAYPENSAEPGYPGGLLGPAELAQLALGAIWRAFSSSPLYDEDSAGRGAALLPSLSSVPLAASELAKKGLGALLWAARTLAAEGALSLAASALEGALERVRDEFFEVLEENDSARRLYLALDLASHCIAGAVEDGVLERGFAAIDDAEWIDWMRGKGVSEYTLRSVLIRGMYHYLYAFTNGDPTDPGVGAGTALAGMARVMFTFRGSVFYHMRAGMGDVVFAPMYEALKARGVTFKFFHRVERLELDASGDKVHKIHMTRQATVTAGDDAYEPLVDVGGLPCWPSTALYAQLDEGAQLEAGGTNLESPYDPWPGAGAVTLELGADFDEIVLGIPPTCYGHIAEELLDADPRMREMAKALVGTATLNAQLWLVRTIDELGGPSRPIIASGFADPLPVWAELTHLLAAESWPRGAGPSALAYFTGQFETSPDPPPYSDHGYPARQLELARARVLQYFSTSTGHIWRRAGSVASPSSLDPDELHSPRGLSGADRWLDQYVRVNVDPSELYVSSPPGSSKLRLRPDGTAFDNLFMAGDWVLTYVTAGSVECAVTAGLHAAEALTGHRLPIARRAY